MLKLKIIIQTHVPPKSCMPSRAKMSINKNSKNKRLIIDRMLFINDITRFLNDIQYL